METKRKQRGENKQYVCEYCDYMTPVKCNYDKHIATDNHLRCVKLAERYETEINLLKIDNETEMNLLKIDNEYLLADIKELKDENYLLKDENNLLKDENLKRIEKKRLKKLKKKNKELELII